MDIIGGIYKIQSIIKPERVYIGSTKNISLRWSTHLSNLRHNRHANKKLQYHFDKYGIEDLEFSVLVECDNGKLIELEQYFIDSYKPWFNIRVVAESNLGCKFSEEVKRKISERLMGNKHTLGFCPSEETRKKQSESRRGRIVSEETRKKISESNMGHTVSLEAREKIRESRKYIIISDETRKKMGEASKGRKPNAGHFHTEETKKKMSEAHKGNKSHLGMKMSEEAIKKMIIAHTGSKRTEETKEKMRAAWVIRRLKMAKKEEEDGSNT